MQSTWERGGVRENWVKFSSCAEEYHIPCIALVSDANDGKNEEIKMYQGCCKQFSDLQVGPFFQWHFYRPFSNVCGSDRNMYQANLTYYARPKLAKQEPKVVTRSLVFLLIPLSRDT